MTPDRLRRIASIFEVALELDESMRRRYLAALAEQDRDLEKRVLELLAEQKPVEDEEATELGARGLGRAADAGHIGPWMIREHLGRGGMGDVYFAERADQEYQRRAAVKLIRKGLESFEGHQRFLAERQILASFDHPNIARLYDGGTADGDRPYLVMEYVEGVRIDRYCNENAHSVRQRLELMLQVCDAVEAKSSTHCRRRLPRLREPS